MATDEETLKRRYREFLDLTPVAATIAGLPPSEGPFNFSADQMEVRGTNIADCLQNRQNSFSRSAQRQRKRVNPSGLGGRKLKLTPFLPQRYNC